MPLTHIRVDKAAEEFFRELDLVDLAKGTMDQKRRTINMLVAEVGASFPAKKLRPEHFKAVLANLKNGASPEEAEMRRQHGWSARRGIKAHNLHLHKATLNQFAKFLRVNGYVSARFEPLYEITHSARPTGNQVDKIVEAIPWQDFGRLLAVAAKAHPRDFMTCLLGLTQGRRVSELQEVKIGDIRWDKSLIKWTNVKRRKEFLRPYDLAVEHYLKEYLAWYRQVQGSELEPDWYLLPPRMGVTEIWKVPDLEDKINNPMVWPLKPDQRVGKATLINAVKAILVEFGYEGDLKWKGIHLLRKSLAQAVDELGPDGLATAMMAHQSRSTTEQWYLGEARKLRQLEEFTVGKDVWGLLPRQPGPEDTPDAGNVVALDRYRKAG